ncbi:hypothetical protein KSP35_13480 [Aquihabitans sp. G128]|uniref:zinc ribbon domain-containing protein n=1 Tax=Aquihabitans sp. G128 TaxID=2849779 RepID=UPI001C22C3BC|nr:zinc ribbon domain-containing protein [Aquihabitans sp. G128]QXC59411.1 hypothetical protein KSP35_13480 [Aquihabitans sp. G128]
MACNRCGTAVPELGRFCPSCGTDAWEGRSGARRPYALQPGEPVLSFNLTSSLMPLAATDGNQTYRFALLAGLAVPIALAAFGLVAAALAAASVVVLAVYLVYLADVDQWESQPVPVLGATVVLSAALGVAVTVLLREGALGGGLAGSVGGFDTSTFLVLALAAPVAGELVRQVGPLLLARQERFGEMLDALTFGVAAGAAYAAAETLVTNHTLFSDGVGWVRDPQLTVWVPLVVTAALVKPVVFGAASGIAVASWSGLGDRPTGFGGRYWRGLGEALVLDVAFAAGLYLSGRLGGVTGVAVGLGWGLLVAAAAILRLRSLLHVAVLEEALESARSGTELRTTAHGTAHCGACELPPRRGGQLLRRLRHRHPGDAAPDPAAQRRRRPARRDRGGLT